MSSRPVASPAGVRRSIPFLLPMLLAIWIQLPSSASALLVEVDLLAAGDGLITYDTDTGLDWLDVSVTSGMSVSQVLGGAGGWVALGFRIATLAEVCALVAAHGAPPPQCPNNLAAAIYSGSGNLALIQILGGTAPSQNFPGYRLLARFDDQDANPNFVGTVDLVYAPGTDRSETRIWAPSHFVEDAFPGWGVLLVREVPAPGAAALLGLACVACVAGPRRRRASS